MTIRNVFTPLENEIVDGVLIPVIEFEEFFDTHSTDDGYILACVDENNKPVRY